MKRTRAMMMTLGILAVSLLWLPAESPATGSADNQIVTPAGFRALRWGSTPADAKETYPDFIFLRYALPDETAPPSRIYSRAREDANLFGVSFGRILYWYRDDRLWKVTAEAGEIVGPRTIQSAAEAGFETLAARMTALHGAPSGQSVSGVTHSSRTMIWNAAGPRISVSLAPGEGDTRFLSLEIDR